MKQTEFFNLKQGSLVRHKSKGTAMTIIRPPADRGIAIAICVVEVMNPAEWDIVDEHGMVISS